MYRAKDTFWAPDNRRIVKGDLVAAHDPVLEGREELFEAVVIPQALAPATKQAAPESSPEGDGQEQSDPPADKPFDPAEHSGDEVLAYLDGADLEEAERVLQAESDGKARKTVLGPGGPLLARKEREKTEEGTQ